jgi:hypothetical protein
MKMSVILKMGTTVTSDDKCFCSPTLLADLELLGHDQTPALLGRNSQEEVVQIQLAHAHNQAVVELAQ